jgi:hypothetical protein
MSDDTYTLDVTILNANGVFSLSYYANDLDAFAEHIGVDHWADEMDLLTEAVNTVGQEGVDRSQYDLSDVSHKMHLAVGQVDITEDGEIQNPEVFEEGRPPRVYQRA